VTRLLPGALGNEASAQNESFSADNALPTGSQDVARLRRSEARGGSDSDHSNGLLLDYPHYTRPAEFRGWTVPEVLIGGNHAEVAKWRRKAAVEKTRRNRPDLLLQG
jgi:tRNA (guanine37-N1)-methyltransferase